MKARLPVEDLRTALATVKPALRSTTPFVVLDTKVGEGLMLAADNWDVQIRTQVREAWAPAKGRGRVAVPHRPLAELVARLATGAEVEMVKGDDVLEVRSGGTDMRLPLAEFDLPERIEPDAEPHEFDVVDWEAVWRVAGVASTDESRPSMQSIVFEPDVVSATDGFRLAIYELKSGLDSRIPAEMIPEVKDPELDQVTVTADDRAVKITVGQTTSWGSPIAADPPKWRGLLDVPYSELITFESEPLLDLVGRVGIAGRMAPAGGHVLVLQPLEEGTIMVSSDSEADDPNGKVEEAIAIDGELQYPVALNSRFLAEAVKVMGMDKTEVQLAGANRPLRFEHAGFTLLLMTMSASR